MERSSGIAVSVRAHADETYDAPRCGERVCDATGEVHSAVQQCLERLVMYVDPLSGDIGDVDRRRVLQHVRVELATEAPVA